MKRGALSLYCEVVTVDNSVMIKHKYQKLFVTYPVLLSSLCLIFYFFVMCRISEK